uniref:CTCK domain-containing protein n=1 Tax=Sphaeramia orbicularis TaxID=375764 RepID=A0A673BZK2_9TELE
VKVPTTSIDRSASRPQDWNIEQNQDWNIAQNQSMQHSCSCCQELATSKQDIELDCPDGSKITHTITRVDTCGCLKTQCRRLTARGQPRKRQTDEDRTTTTEDKHFHFHSVLCGVLCLMSWF